MDQPVQGPRVKGNAFVLTLWSVSWEGGSLKGGWATKNERYLVNADEVSYPSREETDQSLKKNPLSLLSVVPGIWQLFLPSAYSWQVQDGSPGASVHGAPASAPRGVLLLCRPEARAWLRWRRARRPPNNKPSPR